MGRFDQLTQLSKQPAQPAAPETKGAQRDAATEAPPDAEALEATRSPERPNGSTGERPNARTGQRVNARTPERPNGKRGLVRDSFDLYEDQIETLRRLSYKQKLAGGTGSIAQMVREAIDAYLKTQISDK